MVLQTTTQSTDELWAALSKPERRIICNHILHYTRDDIEGFFRSAVRLAYILQPARGQSTTTGRTAPIATADNGHHGQIDAGKELASVRPAASPSTPDAANKFAPNIAPAPRSSIASFPPKGAPHYSNLGDTPVTLQSTADTAQPRTSSFSGPSSTTTTSSSTTPRSTASTTLPVKSFLGPGPVTPTSSEGTGLAGSISEPAKTTVGTVQSPLRPLIRTSAGDVSSSSVGDCSGVGVVNGINSPGPSGTAGPFHGSISANIGNSPCDPVLHTVPVCTDSPGTGVEPFLPRTELKGDVRPRQELQNIELQNIAVMACDQEFSTEELRLADYTWGRRFPVRSSFFSTSDIDIAPTMQPTKSSSAFGAGQASSSAPLSGLSGASSVATNDSGPRPVGANAANTCRQLPNEAQSHDARSSGESNAVSVVLPTKLSADVTAIGTDTGKVPDVVSSQSHIGVTDLAAPPAPNTDSASDLVNLLAAQVANASLNEGEVARTLSDSGTACPSKTSQSTRPVYFGTYSPTGSQTGSPVAQAAAQTPFTFFVRPNAPYTKIRIPTGAAGASKGFQPVVSGLSEGPSTGSVLGNTVTLPASSPSTTIHPEQKPARTDLHVANVTAPHMSQSVTQPPIAPPQSPSNLAVGCELVWRWICHSANDADGRGSACSMTPQDFEVEVQELREKA